MSLDSRRLLYFLRIVEFGSFSQAARSLGISQPALSHHVRQLEEYLGLTLLTRGAQGVAATEPGLQLLEHARAVVGRIEEAERDLRGQAREVAGTVNLGLPSSIAAPMTPLLLKEVRERHPAIVLHTIEGNSTVLAEWDTSERLDFALNLEGVVKKGGTPLFSEDLYLVGPPGALAAYRDTGIAFADALETKLLLPTRRHSMRMLIERKALELGRPVHPVFEIDGFEPLKAAVASGLGNSILSWAGVQKDCASGRLSAARIVGPAISRTLVMDMPPWGRLSRAAAKVRDVVYQVICDQFRTNSWRGRLLFDPERIGLSAERP